MMKRLLETTFILASLLLAACNIDNEILSEPAPVIGKDVQLAYEVKVGRTITISPKVENAEDATYEWRVGDKVVAQGASYEFIAESVSIVYINFTVANSAGSDSREFRVNVMPLTPPIAAFAACDGVIEVERSTPTRIVPHLGGGKADKMEWILDDQLAADGEEFLADFEKTADHNLSLRLTNEDGTTQCDVVVRVVEHLTGRVIFPSPLAGEREDPDEEYDYFSVPFGRELVVAPVVINFHSPSYEWSLGGEVISHEECLRFRPEQQGEYIVCVKVSDPCGYAVSEWLRVECCGEESSYYRPFKEGTSKMGWNKIYDYTPAPGQFINEDKSGFKGVATREQALAYAESRLKQGEYVSLGGWGGSLVAGFDHSIKDGEGYDLIIRGNTHEGSSEPAIVWVMMDSNGNGQPDDVWYELRGSEYDKPSSKVRYALTYHRPVADFMSVRWQGEGELYGEINRTSQHTQPSYFPQWVEGEYYALYGSIVAHNTTIDGAGNYVNNPYAWGYADNMGENTISDDEQSCWFDIANAVCDDGSPAELPHIDFVKVQSAVCHQAGPLGEVSAEVTDIRAR